MDDKQRVRRIREWPVSITGGVKIGPDLTRELLKISYTQLYRYIDREWLLRAEPRHKGLRSQPLVFFLQDVVKLALENETITPLEAEDVLKKHNPTSISAA